MNIQALKTTHIVQSGEDIIAVLAETFEHNNIILQALGTADSVQVDLTYVDLRQSDRLMLCSDGLSGMIRGDEIRQVLMTFADPLQACKELTDRANAAGGHDNITVIVADFVGPGLPPLGRTDDTLCYRKYGLPELSSLASTSTLRAGPDGSAPTGSVEASAAPAVEPKRDSLRVRVANTILGGSVRPPEGTAPPTGNSVPVPNSMRLYDPTQDPISIPVSGLPPTVVGALVILAMVVAAVAGFFLIH